MKDTKFTNQHLETGSEQEIELTEDQLDEVGGGAPGGSLLANDRDSRCPFNKVRLALNPADLVSNPSHILSNIRNNLHA